MGLGDFHRQRRRTALFALLGMAFYALLLPWHTVSQTSLLLDKAAIAAIPMCHADTSADAASPGQKQKRTHCPICTGFAALQFAVSGSTVALLPPVSEATRLLSASDESLVDALVPTAQSRGPPSSASLIS